MTRPRDWLRDHWQPLLIAATAAMVALIFVGTLSALVTGRDTNRTVALQRATADRSVCTSEIYSAWFRAVGDVILTAAHGDDPTPTEVDALDSATADLDEINTLCPPPVTEETP